MSRFILGFSNIDLDFPDGLDALLDLSPQKCGISALDFHFSGIVYALIFWLTDTGYCPTQYSWFVCTDSLHHDIPH